MDGTPIPDGFKLETGVPIPQGFQLEDQEQVDQKQAPGGFRSHEPMPPLSPQQERDRLSLIPASDVAGRLKYAAADERMQGMTHGPAPINPLPTAGAALGALQIGVLQPTGGVIEGVAKAIQGSILEPVTNLFAGDIGKVAEFGTGVRKAGQEVEQLTQPKDPNSYQSNILGAIQSAPTMALAIATTLTTNNPDLGAFIAGLSQYGGGFADVADRKDLTEKQKQGYALETAMAEAMGEMGPQRVFLKAAPSLQFIAKLFGVEVSTELATNIVQQKIGELDKVTEPLTKEQFHRLVNDTIIQTLLLAGAGEAPFAVGTVIAKERAKKEFAALIESFKKEDQYQFEDLATPAVGATQTPEGFEAGPAPGGVPIPEGFAPETPAAPVAAAPAETPVTPPVEAPTGVPIPAGFAPEAPRTRPGKMADIITPDLVSGFGAAVQVAVGELRKRISNVQMDAPGEGWTFDLNGKNYFVKDNNESPATESPNSEAFRAWIVRQFLDSKATETAAVPKAPTATPDAATQADLNKKNARVNRKLGEGRAEVPPEVGGRGDLFGEAAAAELEKEKAKQPESMRLADSDADELLTPEMREKVRQDSIKNRERIARGEFDEQAAKYKTVQDAFEDLTDDRSHGDEATAEAARELRDQFERNDVAGYLAAVEKRAVEIQAEMDGVDQDIEKQAGATYVPLIQAIGAPAQTAGTIALGQRNVQQRTITIPDKPVHRQVAMRLIERLFGVKIYQGKPFKVRKALGFFRPKTGEVRIKKHNDLEVTAHEFFHWLDRRYPTLRALYHKAQFRTELKGVSYDVKSISEGFAEFGRLLLTQEVEAALKAPQFYDAFMREAAQLGIINQIKQTQDLMHAWYQQGAEQRALSKIGKPEYPLGARLGNLVHQISDRMIAKAADYLQAAKVIERTIAGDVQDALASPYKMLRLLAGSRMIANQWVNENTLMVALNDFTDPKSGIRYKAGDMVPSGIGLRILLEPVADVLPETIGYFVGRRAQELKKFGKEQLLDKDEIEALLALPDKVNRRADIEKAFDEYQKYVGRLLDFAQQSGILNDSTRKYWESIYKNYVPFFRITEDFGSPDTGQHTGSVFKRLKGGTSNLNDVLENMVINTEGVVRASLRNMAKTRLYDLVESSRLGQKYAVRIGEDVKPVMIGMEQVSELLKTLENQAAAMAAASGVAPNTNSVFQEISTALAIINGYQNMQNKSILNDIQAQATFFLGHQKPGILDKDFYLKNGKPVWFQIGDPLLWDMIVELNTIKPLTLVEKVLSTSKNTLTRGVTLAPTFQIRNFARDTFNSLTLGKNIKFPIADALVALKDVYFESPEFQAFLNNGGGFGFAIQSDVKKVKLHLERIKHAGKVSTKAVIDTPSRLLAAYDTVAQASELANRLAEFKRALAAGTGAREAAFRAREIGTDFGMRGNAALYRYFAMSVPFGAARLQGLYRIEREVFEHKGKQTLKAVRHGTAIKYAGKSMLWISLPSLVLYLLNKDEDWYQEENDATRDLYWLFQVNGRTIKIPKPFETGMLFGTMAERMWQHMETGNDKEVMDALRFMVISTFSLDGLPQVVRPVYDLWMNKDFRGSPIVNESLLDAAPEEQYTAYTSALAIAAGKKFGVSPAKLEYLIRGYFGYLGGYALFAADSLLEPTTGGVPPKKDLAQYPLLDAFMKAEPTRSTSYEQAFYELNAKINETVATARVIRQRNDADGLASYLGESEQAQLLAMSAATREVTEQVNLLNGQMRMIRFDKQMSAEEKQQKIDALQIQKNLMFRKMVEALGTSDIEQLRDYLEWKPK